MNALKNKIKSQRGASITFALLLFMVCAVLSGVIIVAATTASGRMDQIVESDQRYYAVTSAAELLKDELEGKTIIVETVKTVPSTITQNADGNDDPGTPDADGTTKVVEMWYADGDSDEKPGDVTKIKTLTTPEQIAALSLLDDVAYRVADAEYVKSQTGESPEHLVVAPTDLTNGRALAISATVVSDTTLDSSVFSVDMWERATDKGILTLYVSKKDASDATGKKAYTLKLSFKADVKTTVDVQSSVGTPTDVTVTAEGTTYKIPKTTVTTTVTRMTWSLTGIVKDTMPSST